MLQESLRVVIPSRRRVNLLKDCALRLFPAATVTVAESEMREYARVVPSDQLVPHPDEISGIAPIRQWVLDRFDDEAIVFVDDDVYRLLSTVGYVPINLTQPDWALQAVVNAANIAAEIGAPVFGFNQASADVRKFRMMDWFALNSWSGGVIGVVGRSLRYDTNLRLRADIDFCLQALLKARITFVDNRLCFLHRRFGLTGGNAANRSAERNAQEIAYLRRKWGRYLHVKQAKGTTRLVMHVPRRQAGVTIAT